MRNLKEILKIYVLHINKIGPNKDDSHGLCNLGFVLHNNKILEFEEVLFINNKIKKDFNIGLEFVWEAGLKQPRLDWLNEEIKKLENDKS